MRRVVSFEALSAAKSALLYRDSRAVLPLIVEVMSTLPVAE